MEKEWNGIDERRQFCSMHKDMIEENKQKIPRWIFVTSISAWFAITGIFSVWYSSTLNQFKIEINLRLREIEVHLNERIQISRELYNRDAERNFHILTKIEGGQKVLELKVARIETKQNAVYKKLALE